MLNGELAHVRLDEGREPCCGDLLLFGVEVEDEVAFLIAAEWFAVVGRKAKPTAAPWRSVTKAEELDGFSADAQVRCLPAGFRLSVVGAVLQLPYLR